MRSSFGLVTYDVTKPVPGAPALDRTLLKTRTHLDGAEGGAQRLLGQRDPLLLPHHHHSRRRRRRRRNHLDFGPSLCCVYENSRPGG